MLNFEKIVNIQYCKKIWIVEIVITNTRQKRSYQVNIKGLPIKLLNKNILHVANNS